MTKKRALYLFYLLPLLLLAVGNFLFSVETIARSTFSSDCRDERSPYRFYDFCLYYGGAKLGRSPDRAAFYQAPIQHKYLSQLRGPGSDPLGDDALVMQYAPFVPALLLPFSYFSPDAAYALYFSGSTLALAAAIFLLLKMQQTPSISSPDISISQNNQTKAGFIMTWLAITAAVIGTVPGFVTTMLGQVSNYLLLVTAAYFYCLFKKRDAAGGVLLALSSFKPHYALFWAIPAVAQQRWLLLAVAAVSEVILLTVASLNLGFTSVLHYPIDVIKADNISSCSQVAIIMICLRGLILALNVTGQGASLAFALAAPAMIGALVATFLVWYKLEKTTYKNQFEYPNLDPIDAQLQLQAIAYTVILCLFFSLHSYIYDAVLLVIPTLFYIRLSGTYSKILLATPYLQWLGMTILTKNYHRSLPTALILLALVMVIAWTIHSKKSKT